MHADFTRAQLTENATLVKGLGVKYHATDECYGLLLQKPGQSWIEMSFDYMQEMSQQATLQIVTFQNGFPDLRYAPVTITINGIVLESHYFETTPYFFFSGNSSTEQWDISSYLMSGTNTIHISLCEDAQSDYWLEDLRITTKN